MCVSVFVSARVSCSLSPYTPLHSASKKQRKQQSAVVDLNRPYKQHHKSWFQTSNSIQLRFGLSSPPHTGQTGHGRATAKPSWRQRWLRICGLLSENSFFVSLLWLTALQCIFNIFPPVFFWYPTKKNKDRAHSVNQIILSLYHNCWKPPSQPTTCCYIYCFYYSLRGAHETSRRCHKTLCND